ACTDHDIENVLVRIVKDVFPQALLTNQTTKQIINNVPTIPYPNMLSLLFECPSTLSAGRSHHFCVPSLCFAKGSTDLCHSDVPSLTTPGWRRVSRTNRSPFCDTIFLVNVLTAAWCSD
ncbi:MAG: hypothetical protein WA739_14220, partial [Candidatus Acidiferrales bacterium]